MMVVAAVAGLARRVPVVQVHVPVHEVARLEGPHEPEEDPETRVAGVGEVVDAVRRGMRDEDVQEPAVEDPVPEHPGQEPEHGEEHREVRVLVLPPVVPDAAAETRQDDPLDPASPSPPGRSRRTPDAPGRVRSRRTDPAASRTERPALQVVVAEDEEQRLVQGADDEVVVAQGEISRAQHQVDLAVPGLQAVAVDERIDVIGYAGNFRITRDKHGFFMERHPKLNPFHSNSEGIFLAGTCQAATGIFQTRLPMPRGGGGRGPVVAGERQSDHRTHRIANRLRLCSKCMVCVDLCPYQAISQTEKGVEINEVLCKGCGTCAAACPSGAIVAKHFSDQILAQIEGVLAGL